ncbi:MAG: hypothetical protein HC837_12240, partial [Chloroflexaceae bacterium]|nr:hypothetical protein [Chloroflexaceae bacterium]
MTDPGSILQLGIEAAREGNKEEARNLFRLLTSEHPDHAQAWIWLAGVAENRSERQVALERVLELDPNNELAIKGLQALGARPTHVLEPEPQNTKTAKEQVSPVIEEPAMNNETPASPEASAAGMSSAAQSRDRYDVDEDEFAALDTLSDAFNEDPGAVRRSEPGPTPVASPDADSSPVGPAAPPASSNEKEGRPQPGRRDPRKAPPTGQASRGSYRSPSTRRPPDDDLRNKKSSKSAPIPLLVGLVALLIILCVGGTFFLRDRLPFALPFFGDQVAQETTPVPASTPPPVNPTPVPQPEQPQPEQPQPE